MVASIVVGVNLYGYGVPYPVMIFLLPPNIPKNSDSMCTVIVRALRLTMSGMREMKANPQLNCRDPLLPVPIKMEEEDFFKEFRDSPEPASGMDLQGWPRRLVVHMDNCAGDNKNQYIFGFFGMLVRRNCFQSVKLVFGLPHHGHAE
jgi:hypothetical protein